MGAPFPTVRYFTLVPWLARAFVDLHPEFAQLAIWCSTPFGITDLFATKLYRLALRHPSAQRLSASLISSLFKTVTCSTTASCAQRLSTSLISSRSVHVPRGLGP
jgi:hypothetical protein